MLASIGHHNAVAVIYGVKLSGFMHGFYGGDFIWQDCRRSVTNWKWP
jgi:hypothetical protein